MIAFLRKQAYEQRDEKIRKSNRARTWIKVMKRLRFLQTLKEKHLDLIAAKKKKAAAYMAALRLVIKTKLFLRRLKGQGGVIANKKH